MGREQSAVSSEQYERAHQWPDKLLAVTYGPRWAVIRKFKYLRDAYTGARKLLELFRRVDMSLETLVSRASPALSS